MGEGREEEGKRNKKERRKKGRFILDNLLKVLVSKTKAIDHCLKVNHLLLELLLHSQAKKVFGMF
jgi:hypothetical protein